MLILGNGSLFTKGGYALFDYDEMQKGEYNKKWCCNFTELFNWLGHSQRKGYYGWGGYGGNVFQWNSELNIGFAYCPLDCFYLDLATYKPSLMQKAANDVVMAKRGTI